MLWLTMSRLRGNAAAAQHMSVRSGTCQKLQGRELPVASALKHDDVLGPVSQSLQARSSQTAFAGVLVTDSHITFCQLLA